MVESNHTEERLARIEHMVETIQREQKTATAITVKLALDGPALTPDGHTSRRRNP